MHRRICAALMVLMMCVALGAAPATTPEGVKVTRNAPKISTRTFDPQRPPSEMPPLQGGEAAVTESKYACGVAVGVQITQRGDAKPRMKVTDVKADLQLEIVIWLPTDVTAKIRAHEDGHRDISVHFYKDAEALAKKIARKYIGRDVEIESMEESHTRPVIQRWANEFCGEYLGATQVPGEKAQTRFDELTDHGRNRMSEREAIRRALSGK